MRANAASSDGGTGCVSLDDLAQHVELLVLAARGLAQPERDDGDDDDREPPGCKRPNATRSGPPTTLAMEPTRIGTEGGGDAGGDTHARADPAAQADRIGVGQQRSVHGLVDACETPAPKRAQKNKKMFVARPERKTMMPKKKVARPTIGPRRYRSANQPMGRMPSTRNPPEMPATNTMTPELTWNDAWMLGARTLSPELCRLSRATMIGQHRRTSWSRTLRRPSRSEVCSSWSPAAGPRASSTSSARSWTR